MKKAVALFLVLLVLTGVFGAVHLFAAPGDDDDPLITLSYINDVLMPKIKDMIKGETNQTYKVLEVPKGKKVICDGGTELILRMGKATVIANEKGGISNVTGGFDLEDGVKVPSNSHLIVPLSDGRGVYTEEDAIFMIKGGYTLN